MTADILTNIHNKLTTFSKGQRRIATYILESYDKAAFLTAGALGKAVVAHSLDLLLAHAAERYAVVARQIAARPQQRAPHDNEHADCSERQERRACEPHVRLQHDGRSHPRQDEGDACHEARRKGRSGLDFLVGRVEVVDEGVRLAERAALERRGKDEREPGGRADEHERSCEVAHLKRRHERGIGQQQRQRGAQDDDGDAERELPRERAHSLVVAGHVLRLPRRHADDFSIVPS